MGFFKKKEEKKKFDYSEETKELFAERDAFYAEQRQRMGGGGDNPELANQAKSEPATSREEDVENLLGGGGDFNPYVNSDDAPATNSDSVSVPPSQPQASSSSAAFVCTSCGKDFQEKWGKCPSCGGEMKKAESSSAPSHTPQSSPAPENSSGDPLDDLLGDFGSSDTTSSSEPKIKKVDADDLTSDFGSSKSNHSNRRKVRKVRKVKRSRNSP